jgi:hypothetical protein
MWFCWRDGNLESFVSCYFRQDRVDQAIANYAYTDYTGLKDEAGIATDKEVTDRVSALMLKLLVILNTRPQLVEPGQCVRPQKIKHGRVKHCELWSPNLIGRSYRTIREAPGGESHRPLPFASFALGSAPLKVGGTITADGIARRNECNDG